MYRQLRLNILLNLCVEGRLGNLSTIEKTANSLLFLREAWVSFFAFLFVSRSLSGFAIIIYIDIYISLCLSVHLSLFPRAPFLPSLRRRGPMNPLLRRSLKKLHHLQQQPLLLLLLLFNCGYHPSLSLPVSVISHRILPLIRCFFLDI